MDRLLFFRLRGHLFAYTDALMNVEPAPLLELELARSAKRMDLVEHLFKKSEPANAMLLLRRTRKRLHHHMETRELMNEELVALSGAVCRVCDCIATFAQVPQRPKSPNGKPGDNAKPILPIA